MEVETGDGENYTLVCDPEALLIPNAATPVRAEWRWGARKTTRVPFGSEEVRKNTSAIHLHLCFRMQEQPPSSLSHFHSFRTLPARRLRPSALSKQQQRPPAELLPLREPHSPPPASAAAPESASRAGNRPRARHDLQLRRALAWQSGFPRSFSQNRITKTPILDGLQCLHEDDAHSSDSK